MFNADLLVGATAGVVAEQINKQLAPTHEKHTTILQSIHDEIKLLNKFLSSHHDDISLLVTLRSDQKVSLSNFGRKHLYLLSDNIAQILVDVPGVGSIPYTLFPGWTRVDVPDGSSAYLPVAVSSSSGANFLLRATDDNSLGTQQMTTFQQAVLAGAAYNASMPNLAPVSGSNYCWQIYNPSTSTKNIYISSLLVTNASGNTITTLLTTGLIDFSALTPVSATTSNLNTGLSAQKSVATVQYTTAGGVPTLTNTSVFQLPIETSNNFIELFSSGTGLLLTPGNGLYLQTFLNANNAFSITTRYMEFYL